MRSQKSIHLTKKWEGHRLQRRAIKVLQKVEREISGTKMNLEGWNGPGKGSEGLSLPNHPSTEAPMSHRTLSKVTTPKWKSADLPIQDCCCLCDHIPLWLPWEAGWPPWSGWPWRNPGWDPGEHVGWGPTNIHSIYSTSISVLLLLQTGSFL